jgi:predicted dehydrogenase
MGTIRLGIIGAGQIAGFTAREFGRNRDCEIVAVADPSAERAAALAADTGAAGIFTDAQSLLRGADIDAVYVAVPNVHHESVASAALNAGKPVLLDKPFALDLPAAERIAAAAAANDQVLMLGMNQRFDRNVQRARALCQSGRFGDIYHVKAFWRRRTGIPRMGSWFTSRAMAGGGALLDIGVHVLDVALHLLDNFNPTSVSGATFTRFGNRGLGEGGWGRSERAFETFDVDDFATALIRLDGGAVITLEAAWALHQGEGTDHDVLLYGEDAGMAVYTDRLFEAAPEGGYQVVQGTTTAPISYPHCSRAEHFINVLRGTESPIIDIHQALTVQRILDAIYQSAASGREVGF